MKTLLVLSVLIAGLGCTENQRAKKFGGNMKVSLPAGQKLTVATWKNDDLWYLTRPMRENEVPETSTFTEDSSFGVIEGTVVFTEHGNPTR